MMFETALFLGFPLSGDYKEQLNLLPAAQSRLFVQSEESPYLQKIEVKGFDYLGKFLGSCIDWKELDLSCSHIMSLLKKLIPEFPYEDHPLILLSLPCDLLNPPLNPLTYD